MPAAPSTIAPRSNRLNLSPAHHPQHVVNLSDRGARGAGGAGSGAPPAPPFQKAEL